MQLKNLIHLDDGMISATVIREDGSVELVVFDSEAVLHKELQRGRQEVGRYTASSNRTLN